MAQTKNYNIEAIYIGTKGAGWTEASKVPITDATYEVTYEEKDVSDNSSGDDDIDIVLMRAARTGKISGEVYNSGAVLMGTNISLTFDSVAYPVSSVDFTEAYGEVDVTDGATTGDGRETITTKAKRNSKISAWVRHDKDDIPLNSKKAATLTFATGCTIAGSALFNSKSITAKFNDAQKIDCNCSWTGVTKTLPGLPSVAVEEDCKIVFKSGTGSTFKGVEGKIIVTTTNVKADIDNPVTWSCDFKFNGAVTESKATL